MLTGLSSTRRTRALRRVVPLALLVPLGVVGVAAASRCRLSGVVVAGRALVSAARRSASGACRLISVTLRWISSGSGSAPYGQARRGYPESVMRLMWIGRATWRERGGPCVYNKLGTR